MTLLRKAGMLLAALAMFSIAGGHWAVLQTVAWGQMLTEYTRQSGSVLTAVEETFDGEHPCALCKEIAVAKGQANDAERSRPAGPSDPSPKVKVEKKAGTLDGWSPPAGLAHPTVGTFCWHTPVFAAVGSRLDAPPVPPPRAAFA